MPTESAAGISSCFAVYGQQYTNFMLGRQIYREQLFDLLCGRPRDASQVELREGADGRTCLPGVTRRPAGDVCQALQCVCDGVRKRATAATARNSVSSRSHAVLTLTLETRAAGDGPHAGAGTRAQLHLVDLAGSERVKKTLVRLLRSLAYFISFSVSLMRVFSILFFISLHLSLSLSFLPLSRSLILFPSLSVR